MPQNPHPAACHWCFKPTSGLAYSSASSSMLPSCGGEHCGWGFEVKR